MSLLPIVKAWVWISALASLAGWTLSALGQLNRAGYAVFAGICVLGFWIYRREAVESETQAKANRPLRVRRRFSRFLPAAFLVLCGIVLLGGLLYPPTNHAGLTYRTPRVLQWLSEEGWFWIHTPSYRMNNRTCGFEWLSAPLLLFTKTDRLLFLLNFIPFILMPGQVFSVFTRLRVSPRVAWAWMWLLPTGYCFLLQAASIGNDTFPTVYILAAIEFALRARESRRWSDLALSVVAAAMVTGAKASNAPLLLGWLLVFLTAAWRIVPRLRLLPPSKRALWGLMAALTLIIALSASLLPTAYLNVKYCGDWTGLKLERAGMDMKSPIVGLWGNALLFALHNYVPPFFPPAKWWNTSALHVLPEAIVRPMSANFEDGYHLLWELPTEDWVGLGFGVTMLLTVSAIGAYILGSKVRMSPGRVAGHFPNALRWVVILSPWLALAIYCLKSGMVTGARIISPYYPLLALIILAHHGHFALVQKRWWRLLAACVVLIAVPVVAVAPARPLWPAKTILGGLAARNPDSRLVNRARQVYEVYAMRSDPLATVRSALPADLPAIGFLADGDDMDISLWRPFFSRKVHHILWSDSVETTRQRGITYAVLGGAYLKSLETEPRGPEPAEARPLLLAKWLKRHDAELLSTHIITLKVNEGPQPWFVVRVPRASAAPHD